MVHYCQCSFARQKTTRSTAPLSCNRCGKCDAKMTLIQVFDRLFQYMPPLEHKQPKKEAAPPAPAPSVDVPPDDPDPLSLQERLAAGRTFTPPIPGQVGAGGLTPEQQAHVRQQYQNP